MRDRRPPRSSWTIAVLVVLCSPVFGSAEPPLEYVAELDGRLVTVERQADGSTLAAWVRDGRSRDLQLTRFDPLRSTWSAPETAILPFEVSDPAIDIDAAGTTYLVYTDRSTETVGLAVLPAGSTVWRFDGTVSNPVALASAGTVRVVGDRVVIAFLEGNAVRIVDRPIHVSADPIESGRVDPLGIQEGPDVVDPLGRWAQGGGGKDKTPDDSMRRRDERPSWSWVTSQFGRSNPAPQ